MVRGTPNGKELSESEIRIVHRKIVSICHTDKTGGSHRLVANLNASRDEALGKGTKFGIKSQKRFSQFARTYDSYIKIEEFCNKEDNEAKKEKMLLKLKEVMIQALKPLEHENGIANLKPLEDLGEELMGDKFGSSKKETKEGVDDILEMKKKLIEEAEKALREGNNGNIKNSIDLIYEFLYGEKLKNHEMVVKILEELKTIYDLELSNIYYILTLSFSQKLLLEILLIYIKSNSHGEKYVKLKELDKVLGYIEKKNKWEKMKDTDKETKLKFFLDLADEVLVGIKPYGFFKSSFSKNQEYLYSILYEPIITYLGISERDFSSNYYFIRDVFGKMNQNKIDFNKGIGYLVELLFILTNRATALEELKKLNEKIKNDFTNEEEERKDQENKRKKLEIEQLKTRGKIVISQGKIENKVAFIGELATNQLGISNFQAFITSGKISVELLIVISEKLKINIRDYKNIADLIGDFIYERLGSDVENYKLDFIVSFMLSCLDKDNIKSELENLDEEIKTKREKATKENKENNVNTLKEKAKQVLENGNDENKINLIKELGNYFGVTNSDIYCFNLEVNSNIILAVIDKLELKIDFSIFSFLSKINRHGTLFYHGKGLDIVIRFFICCFNKDTIFEELKKLDEELKKEEIIKEISELGQTLNDIGIPIPEVFIAGKSNFTKEDIKTLKSKIGFLTSLHEYLSPREIVDKINGELKEEIERLQRGLSLAELYNAIRTAAEDKKE